MPIASLIANVQHQVLYMHYNLIYRTNASLAIYEVHMYMCMWLYLSYFIAHNVLGTDGILVEHYKFFVRAVSV